MKHLDLSVCIPSFVAPMVALELHGVIKVYRDKLQMLYEMSSDPSFQKRAHELYQDFLHPTIPPIHQWSIDNFRMIVEDLGYKIIFAK